MNMRHFVIADIHGHAVALESLLQELSLSHNDRVTFLGDYIDHGPDSRRVIDIIRLLNCHSQCLMGNHESLLLASLHDSEIERHWRRYGGDRTLESFGVAGPQDIPSEYIDWIQSLRAWVEDSDSIFVHAGLNPALAMVAQTEDDLLWIHPTFPIVHVSGKTVYSGHTPRVDPLVSKNHISLDTGITSGGLLSCYCITNGEWVQSDTRGNVSKDAHSLVNKRDGVI